MGIKIPGVHIQSPLPPVRNTATPIDAALSAGANEATRQLNSMINRKANQISSKIDDSVNQQIDKVAHGNKIVRAALKAGYNAAANTVSNSIRDFAMQNFGSIPIIGDAFTSNQALDGLFSDPGGAGGRGWLQIMQSRPDPLFQIDWDIDIEGFSKAREYAEEVQIPMTSHSNDQIFRDAGHIYIAGFSDTNAVSITFYEDNLLTVTRWIQNWRKVMHGPDGTYALPSKYKRRITVYPTDAQGNRIATIVMTGCFPTTIPVLPFHSNGSDRVTLAIEFSVDRCDVKFAGGDSSSADPMAQVKQAAALGRLMGLDVGPMAVVDDPTTGPRFAWNDAEEASGNVIGYV